MRTRKRSLREVADRRFDSAWNASQRWRRSEVGGSDRGGNPDRFEERLRVDYDSRSEARGVRNGRLEERISLRHGVEFLRGIPRRGGMLLRGESRAGPIARDVSYARGDPRFLLRVADDY